MYYNSSLLLLDHSKLLLLKNTVDEHEGKDGKDIHYYYLWIVMLIVVYLLENFSETKNQYNE